MIVHGFHDLGGYFLHVNPPLCYTLLGMAGDSQEMLRGDLSSSRCKRIARKFTVHADGAKQEAVKAVKGHSQSGPDVSFQAMQDPSLATEHFSVLFTGATLNNDANK